MGDTGSCASHVTSLSSGYDPHSPRSECVPSRKRKLDILLCSPQWTLKWKPSWYDFLDAKCEPEDKEKADSADSGNGNNGMKVDAEEENEDAEEEEDRDPSWGEIPGGCFKWDWESDSDYDSDSYKFSFMDDY